MNEIITLNGLATDIREKHQAAIEAAGKAVRYAIEAGELLIQAKAQVAHGQWAHWLKANVQFSERTAQGYMRLARELPKLDGEKAQRVADLPLRLALQELTLERGALVVADDSPASTESLRLLLGAMKSMVRDWNARLRESDHWNKAGARFFAEYSAALDFKDELQDLIYELTLDGFTKETTEWQMAVEAMKANDAFIDEPSNRDLWEAFKSQPIRNQHNIMHSLVGTA